MMSVLDGTLLHHLVYRTWPRRMMNIMDSLFQLAPLLLETLGQLSFLLSAQDAHAKLVGVFSTTQMYIRTLTASSQNASLTIIMRINICRLPTPFPLPSVTVEGPALVVSWQKLKSGCLLPAY